MRIRRSSPSRVGSDRATEGRDEVDLSNTRLYQDFQDERINWKGGFLWELVLAEEEEQSDPNGPIVFYSERKRRNTVVSGHGRRVDSTYQ